MGYFTTIKNIKDNTQLDSSLSDRVIMNMLDTAQDVHLQEVLGSDLYNQIQTNIDNNAVTTKQRELIEKYISKYLYALIDLIAIDDLIIKLSNSGIYSQTPQNTQARSIDELKSIKVTRLKKISTYRSLIKSYIQDTDNKDEFDLYESDDNYIEPVKTPTAGFYIPDEDRD